MPAKKLLTYIFVFSIFTLASYQAVAKETSDSYNKRDYPKLGIDRWRQFVETQKERFKDNREEFTEKRKDLNAENRCELRKKAIENKRNWFAQWRDEHPKRFDEIRTRLENLIEKLEAEDIDASQLKANLETLKGKTDAFKTKRQELVTKLDELKDLDCADTEGYKNTLDEIKAILNDLRTMGKDIKDYIIGTIKPELKRLHQLLEQAKEGD